MLPCNVIVQDVGSGFVEVLAVDPVASMAAIEQRRVSRQAKPVAVTVQQIEAERMEGSNPYSWRGVRNGRRNALGAFAGSAIGKCQHEDR